MNINEIDKFRNEFFDKVLQSERDKEKARKLEQKTCFHNYNIKGVLTVTGYQERTCSKCGHTAIKSLKIWDGERNGACVIS